MNYGTGIVPASVTKGSLRLLDYGYSLLQLYARIDSENARRRHELCRYRAAYVLGNSIESISQYEGFAKDTGLCCCLPRVNRFLLASHSETPLGC